MTNTPYRISRRVPAMILLILVSALAWDFSVHPQTNRAMVRLEPLGGTVYRAEIAAGTSHSFSLVLKENDFVHITIDQRGIDLVASIYDPANRPVHRADWRWSGTESVSWVSDGGGSYRMELSSRRRGGAPVARRIGVNNLHAQTIGSTGKVLQLFLGAACLLLILAGMNAAALLLARSLNRAKEFGVRMALGAGRVRLARLLILEAGILALVGGVLGVLLAYAGVALLLRYVPASIPLLNSVTVDARVLMVAAAVSLGTGIGAGLLPALRLARRGPWDRHFRVGSPSGCTGVDVRSRLWDGCHSVVGAPALRLSLRSGTERRRYSAHRECFVGACICSRLSGPCIQSNGRGSGDRA